MKKKQEHIHILSKTIGLVWRSSPSNMSAILIINIIIGIIVPVNLIVWKYFLDSIVQSFDNSSSRNVLFWLVLYSALLIMQEGCIYISTYLREMQSDYLNKYITEIMLDKINSLQMIDFDNSKIYDNINKINNEALAKSTSIISNIMEFIKNLISIIGTIGIFISYNWFFILISTIAYLPVIIVNLKIYEKLHEIYENRIEKLRFIEDLKWILIRYENVKEIRIFKAGSFLKNTIIGIYTNYIHEDKTVRKKNLKNISLINIIHYVTSFVLKAFIVVTGMNKKKSIGSISMYITSLDTFQQSLNMLIATFTEIYNDNLYVATLFEFLDKESEERRVNGKLSIKYFQSIEFCHVYFKYPNTEKYILENINFRIENKKSYLLVGLNGAGKTTLIKLLCGLYEPTKGEILLNGINIEKYKKEDVNELFTAVFQDYIRYPLDIESNIKISNIEKWDNNSRMIYLVKKFGLENMIRELPYKYKTRLLNEWKDSTELSGGQWQKLAIGRGLFSEAPVLIMDEPTAALDPQAENDLMNNIKEISDDRVCIIISHRYTTATTVNEIMVLENKTIQEKGTFNQLMSKRGAFFSLFSIQADKYREK